MSPQYGEGVEGLKADGDEALGGDLHVLVVLAVGPPLLLPVLVLYVSIICMCQRRIIHIYYIIIHVYYIN